MQYFTALCSLFHLGMSGSTGDKMHALQGLSQHEQYVHSKVMRSPNESGCHLVSQLFSDLFLLSLCPVVYHPNLYYQSFYHLSLLHSGNFNR